MSDDEPSTPPSEPAPGPSFDLRARLKELTQPLVDGLDARLAAQVEKRVDEILKDRLAVIERAIADLDRAVKDLEGR